MLEYVNFLIVTCGTGPLPDISGARLAPQNTIKILTFSSFPDFSKKSKKKRIFTKLSGYRPWDSQNPTEPQPKATSQKDFIY